MEGAAIRLSILVAMVTLLGTACGGESVHSPAEADRPGIYAAVASELAQLGQVDGVVYFVDTIAELPEVEPTNAAGLIEVGAPLSPSIRAAIREAVSDYEVEFGDDWAGLAREQCDVGRPWGEYVYYRFGPAESLGADEVRVVVELNDVNSPAWELVVLTRSSDGWKVTERTSTGLFSSSDACP